MTINERAVLQACLTIFAGEIYKHRTECKDYFYGPVEQKLNEVVS